MERLMAFARTFGVSVCGVSVFVSAASCSDPSSEQEAGRRLYVLWAGSGRVEGQINAAQASLVLEDVNTDLLWYADRPSRESGSTNVATFLTNTWPEMFRDTPPNAYVVGWDAANQSAREYFVQMQSVRYSSETKNMVARVEALRSTETPPSEIALEHAVVTILNNAAFDERGDRISFTQQGTSVSIALGEDQKATVTWTGVTDGMHWVDNAPGTSNGTLSVERFVAEWQERFEEDPPNASLWGLDANDNARFAVLELQEPSYDASQSALTYQATLLEGNVTEDVTLIHPHMVIDDSDGIELKLIHLIATQLGIQEDQISLQSNYVNDLGADSLDVVELIMAVEQEFGVIIPDDDADQLQTVEATVSYLQRVLS